eukprot:TRINITY_DN76187_c0_g1_i1.p1 TRINITY_DN76187_c0_g1~~TRINITY_DN76187_c0_g1_i1.p1  ORF type:complete len:4582 (-),score=777.11 TRINITY_DN76187_c0_g1_i1:88-13833(-)
MLSHESRRKTERSPSIISSQSSSGRSSQDAKTAQKTASCSPRTPVGAVGAWNGLSAEEAAWQLACDCAKSVAQVTQRPQEASELVLRVWEATAQAIAKELDAGKTIVVQGLGIFGLGKRVTKPSAMDPRRTETRHPIFMPSEDFLRTHGLHSDCLQTAEKALHRGPRAKHSVAQEAKALGVATDVVLAALDALFFRLGSAMAGAGTFGSIAVSFSPLGIFSCKDRNLNFQPQPRSDVPEPVLIRRSFWPSIAMKDHVAAPSNRTQHEQRQAQQPAASPERPERPDSAGRADSRKQAVAVESLKPTPPPTKPPHRGKRRPGSELKDLLGQTFRSPPDDSLKFPALLEASNRTQAVPYGGPAEPSSVSSRIATNYSSPAARLSCKRSGVPLTALHWRSEHPDDSLPALPESAVDYSTFFPHQQLIDESPVAQEIEEAGISRAMLFETLYRYDYYLQESVPDSALSPYDQSWKDNIEKLIDHERLVSQLPPKVKVALLEEVQSEVHQDYLRSLKRAVVDHVLEDELARQRTGIPFIPCPVIPWGSKLHIGIEGSLGGRPRDWPDGVASRREVLVKQLLVCSPVTLMLAGLWQREFAGLLLFDLTLPPSGAKPSHDLESFCKAQTAQRDHVRQRLEAEWLGQVASLLQEAWPACEELPQNLEEGAPDTDFTAGKVGIHEFPRRARVKSSPNWEAASTLLSRQSRSIVENSLTALLRFFDLFATEMQAADCLDALLGFTPRSRTPRRQCVSFLTVGLKASGEDVVFTSPPEKIAEGLTATFQESVVALCRLERPDVKLGRWSGNGRPTLWDVSLDEQQVKEAKSRLRSIIHRNLKTMARVKEIYGEFKHLLVADVRARRLAEDPAASPKDYMLQLNSLRQAEATVRDKCERVLHLQMVAIDCGEINDILCKKAQEAEQFLVEGIHQTLLSRNERLCDTFKTALTMMKKKPNCEGELGEMEDHMQRLEGRGRKQLLEDHNNIKEWLAFLFKCQDRLSMPLLLAPHLEALFEGSRFVMSIEGDLSDHIVNLRNERSDLEGKFMEQRSKFLEDLDFYSERVEDLHECKDLRMIDQYIEKINRLKKEFEQASIEAEELRAREERFGWEPSKFEILTRGQKALEPYESLWILAHKTDRSMKMWMKGPLLQLDPVKVEVDAEALRKEAARLQDLFLKGAGHVWTTAKEAKNQTNAGESDSEGEAGRMPKGDIPTPAAVAGQLEEQAVSMQGSNLGLVQALCNQNLQSRHWLKISQQVGFVMDESQLHFTLNKAREAGLSDFVTQLQDISHVATKEREIEVGLDAMEATWRPIEMELLPWKETDTCVIADSWVDEVRVLWESHKLKVRLMKSSRFLSVWAKRLSRWEAWLEYVSIFLERWVSFQNDWKHLEPVFVGRDISKHMPTEWQFFRKADNVWRQLVDTTIDKPAIFEVSKQPDLLERLTSSCKLLEKARKGLTGYLQSRRIAFPRFFMITDEKLIEILIDVKHLSLMQPHLRICFPGIWEVRSPHDAQSAYSQVQLMVSGSGRCFEAIPLDSDVLSSASFDGGIEEWFRDLETSMQSALKSSCMQALRGRASQDRSEWLVADHGEEVSERRSRFSEAPFQAILCADEVLRTQEIAQAISDNSLPSLLDQINGEMNQLCQITSSDLRPVAVHLLPALLGHDAHCRDVLDHLITQRVTSISDFDWLSRLRYYVELESDYLVSDDVAQVKVGMGVFLHTYEYEYYGVAPRLIMTPQTERAYRALCCALGMNQGAALQGPTGSGKTETIKDVAKALAVMCFSILCTPSFDVKDASRYLQGAISSGTWCCFEQLQTAESEVLSVLAQQMMVIQQAVLTKSKYFELEGKTTALRGGFISMTLPLQTCIKMPEGLRAQVRSIAMVAPSVERIAEVRLLSLGFQKPGALARKLAEAFTLGRDLCHGLQHDFSLRTVSDVLAFLASQEESCHGSLATESHWLHLALLKVLSRVLPQRDFFAWECILKDIFPDSTATLPMSDNSALKLALRKQFQVAGLPSVPHLESKAAELYEALLARPAVLAIGDTLSGKSASLKALASALTTQASLAGKASGPGAATTRLISLTPGCLTSEQLFGTSDLPGTSNGERKRSLLGSVIAGCKPAESERQVRASSKDASEKTQRQLSRKKTLAATSKRNTLRRLSQKRTSAPIDLAQSTTLRQSADRRPSHVSDGSEPANDGEPEDASATWLLNSLAPRHWLHFDGDIESWWAQPLHPLLEGDSQGLRLYNGEVMIPPANLGLVFECDAVASAAPATVARCALVYFGDPQPLQQGSSIEALLSQKLPGSLTQQDRHRLVKLSMAMVPVLLQFMRIGHVELLIPNAGEHILMQSFASALAVTLHGFPDARIVSTHRVSYTTASLDAAVVLACTWSFGALAANYQGRRTFDAEIRRVLKEEDVQVSCPSWPQDGESLIFDFAWDHQSDEWRKWLDLHRKDLADTMLTSHLIVPSSSTASTTMLAAGCCTANVKAVICGPSACGKTTCVREALRNLPAAKFSKIHFAFHSFSRASEVQARVDGMLENQGSDSLGPLPGSSCIFFVDDLSLPAGASYTKHAQSCGQSQALELVRQFCNYGGWFDSFGASQTFRHVRDCLPVATMATQRATAQISRRLLRHFFVLGMLPETTQSLRSLFSTILKRRFTDHSYPAETVEHASNFARACVNACLKVADLLQPTPSQPNLAVGVADMWKLVECLQLMRLNSEQATSENLARLWVHESLRLLSDRCSSDQDHLKVVQGIEHAARADPFLTSGISALRCEHLLFTNALSQPEPDSGSRPYEELQDFSGLRQRLDMVIHDMGEEAHEFKDFVAFPAAMHHILRIARALAKSPACALVVGCPQSGRRSLAKLAINVSGMVSVEPSSGQRAQEDDTLRSPDMTIRSWRKNVKQMLLSIGGKNPERLRCMLCGDVETASDDICADINQLLSLGDLPDLWQKDDKAHIIEVFEHFDKRGKDSGGIHAEAGAQEESDGMGQWLRACNYFAQRCRSRLRLVLSISPVGDIMRHRLRQFPALTKYATVDWFGEWPVDAFHAIAESFLASMNLGEELVPVCTRMCQHVHTHIMQIVKPYKQAETMGRWCYHSSWASFIELLHVFIRILSATRAQWYKMESQYRKAIVGLHKMQEQRQELHEFIKTIGPEIEAKEADIDQSLKDYEAQGRVTEQTKAALEAEELAAEAPLAKLSAIKAECEQDFTKSKQAVAAAKTAIENLTSADLQEIRAMRNPSNTIKKVLETVCVMKGHKISRAREEAEKHDAAWALSHKMISEAGFIHWILNFDKDNLPNSIAKTVAKMLADDDLEISKVERTSKAVHGLFCWVKAILDYDATSKAIKPKKQALKKAEDEYAKLMEKLEERREQLKAATDLQMQLKLDLAGNRQVLKDMIEKQSTHAVRVERFEALIARLTAEQGGWREGVNALHKRSTLSAGDSLLAAATVTHFGLFSSQERFQITTSFKMHMRELKLPYTDDFTVVGHLKDIFDMQAWAEAGLEHSTRLEAAAMASVSQRCSLLIDPQGQGSRWLKKMETRMKLFVVPANDIPKAAAMVRAARSSMRPVLLDGLPESGFGPEIIDLLMEQLGWADNMRTAALTRRGAKRSASIAVLQHGEGGVSSKEATFITTRAESINLPPEASRLVTVVDFNITPECMEEQLLHHLLESLEPKVAKQQVALQDVIANAEKGMKAYEDQLIKEMCAAEDRVLENDTLLATLEKVRREQQRAAEELANATTELQQVEERKDCLRPTVGCARCVCFAVAKLAKYSPMYRYSFSYLEQLFRKASLVGVAEMQSFIWSPDTKQQLLSQILQEFIKSVHAETSATLMSQHRSVFTVLLALDVQRSRPGAPPGSADAAELLLESQAGIGSRPSTTDLTPQAWSALETLSRFQPCFHTLAESFRKNLAEWQKALANEELEKARLPEPFNSLSHLQRLLLLRAARPDLCSKQLERWAESIIGCTATAAQRTRCEPDLDAALSRTNDTAPLILIILAPGADSLFGLPKLAAKYFVELRVLALGRGRGFHAQAVIDDSREAGHWVLLQNCHLQPDWLPQLETLCDRLSTSPVHTDFRLWLSSQECATFPSTVLHSSAKVVSQAPVGIKASLCYLLHLQPLCEVEFFEKCAARADDWKRLLHAMLCTHAVLCARHEYGELGWVVPYDCEDGDLLLSLHQLQCFIERHPLEAPQKLMHNVVMEMSYGTRVADQQDKLLMQLLFGSCFQGGECKASPAEGSAVWQLCSVSESFHNPRDSTYQGFLKAMEGLPNSDDPSLLGFSAAAGAHHAWNCSAEFFSALTLRQENRLDGYDGNDWAHCGTLATQALELLPQRLDMEQAVERCPSGSGSINFVMLQEVEKYNALLGVISDSLESIADACLGRSSLCPAIESQALAIQMGKVPHSWRQVSFMSCKPAHSYLHDLGERFNFIRSYLEQGPPILFWLSGLFAPRAFCQALLQEFARSQRLPMQSVTMETHIVPDMPTEKPERGVCVRGLYLQNCRWDEEHCILEESEIGALWVPCPLIWLRPVEISQTLNVHTLCYECPLYDMAFLPENCERLPNLVSHLSLRVGEEGPDHWLRRGARALLQLTA